MFLFAEGGHHQPLIVEFLNHYFGDAVYHFQITYTKPIWDRFFQIFGTDAEAMFGPYTPETAIPWPTVMFVIACLLTVAIIWILRGQLSEDDPDTPQLTLESAVIYLKNLITDTIGPHGTKYFPVVATFACLILVSNLMGQFPMFMSPTASVNVTFALGISSFIYYNAVGIRENGLINHIKHLAGPKLPWYMFLVTMLIFGIELISNMIRPFTLGVRLFANMYSDEQVFVQITNLYPPVTHYLIPLVFTLLGVFVAFVQTLVFTLLSMSYIAEVTHPPHDEEHGEEAHAAAHTAAA
ncbi:MAG TPA: F0F1 ATP synthase subunit A [Pyrinomonadaceae bacterium]|jgi:F-type H+-transporting ATPase subunit a|nr:F0F1 ATP synthase subunit A [Pyrinomonadaceae bacterium]